MSNIISHKYSEIEDQLVASSEKAQSVVDDDELLVAVIHPDVDEFIREQAGLDDGAELRGIAGIRNVMITESVPGFAVVICNENL